MKKTSVKVTDGELNGAPNGAPNGEPNVEANAESIASNTKTGKDEKKEKESLDVVSFTELFRYADGLDKFLMFMGTICAMVHGAGLPSLMIVLGEMTDLFVSSASSNAFNLTALGLTSADLQDPAILKDLESNYNITINNGLFSKMKVFALYYFVIGIVIMFMAYGQVSFWLITSNRQAHKIRIDLFRAILRQEIGWFDTHDIKELNTRISDDVNKVQEGLGDKISNFVQWITMFFICIIIGFAYGWKLTLVIIAFIPALAISAGFMLRMITIFTKWEQTAYAKAGAVAEEVFGAIRTVIAFGGEPKECTRFEENLIEAKRTGLKKAVVAGVGLGSMYFLMFSVYALAFWFGSKLVREDPNYNVGTMLTVFFCVLMGAFGLGHATPNITNIATARGAAYVIYQILASEPKIDSSSEEGQTLDNIKGDIEFRDVAFRYPSRPEVSVLEAVNIKISVGQTVALVGASGCGKSTVVQLLQRFYDPEQGAIFVDGVNIRELNVRWLREHIGLVSQEPVLFGTTVAENIRYGRLDVSQDEIESACKEANAHEFITKLPDGYKTLVGERGAQLSGGQKQRVAIARALVSNPKILLLDEATSALDTESEAIVQDALEKAQTGRTTIIVAHRLSTISTADVIVGFKSGSVAEMGTHNELMEHGGIYHQLVTNQTQNKDAAEEDVDATVGGLLAKNSPLKSQVSVKAEKEKELEDEHEDEDEENLPDADVWRILKMNSPEIVYIIVGCIAATANGAIQPLFAIVFGEVLGVFVKPLEEQEEQSLLFSMMFLVIGVGTGVAILIQSFCFGVAGEALTMRIRVLAFKCIIGQDMEYFDNHKNSVGALTSRLAVDATALQGVSGARIGTLVQSMAGLLTAFTIGFIYSWKLTLTVLAFAPFIMIGGVIQMKIIQGDSTSNKSALEMASKYATEAISNMRTVASLTREQTFLKNFEQQLAGPLKATLFAANKTGLSFGFTQGLMFFTYAACFSLGAYLIEQRELTFDQVFKVIFAIMMAAMGAGQASAFAPDYGKGKASAARLLMLVDRKPAINAFSEEGDTIPNYKGSLEFRNVNFNYPTRATVPVLTDLSMMASAGQTVALVGASGCGKSTCVQLAERFYDIAGGNILLDGKSLKSLNIRWLRSQMGIVSQEPVLFDSSIRENIEYGDNSRKVGMDEVIVAARQANIHSFIENLPNGYETNCGDKGTQLSGGQKQRVAIARALLRNPKVLLLDEATSALDTESEKVVQEALDKARMGRTSLVIAHRLSTIQNADKIIVLRNGAVAEEGTHDQLVALKGFYYKLNSAQLRQA